MYNMYISIFGYKFNLEILILIGVVYIILVGHTVCGCCNYSLMEAFTDASGNTNVGNAIKAVAASVKTDVSNNTVRTNLHTDASNGTLPQPAGGIVANKVKGAVSAREGFAGANTNFGQSSPYDLTGNSSVDTSSWMQPNLVVQQGKPVNSAVKQFLSRKQQQLPLQNGEMDFFANVEFKPECCPNTYSTSTGCACMTSKDYNYLVTRSGNNVPYSEY